MFSTRHAMDPFTALRGRGSRTLTSPLWGWVINQSKGLDSQRENVAITKFLIGELPLANLRIHQHGISEQPSNACGSPEEGLAMATFDQLKQVLRRLVKAPLFTAVTLITLAIGIGANTVIFSVVESVLLKPLSYPHADGLIGVWYHIPGIDIQNMPMAPFLYFIEREQNSTLQDIGVYTGDSLSVTGAGQPEHVRGLDVTDGTLPLLGAKPVLGRLFNRRNDSAGAPQTVMISYGYWKRKFSGSDAVIGHPIMVDGKPREIIGVLPKDFHFLDREDASLYLPMQWDRGKTSWVTSVIRALPASSRE